jgi:hypothetical protein
MKKEINESKYVKLSLLTYIDTFFERRMIMVILRIGKHTSAVKSVLISPISLSPTRNEI